MAELSFLRVVLAWALAISFAAGGIAMSGGSRTRILVPVSGGLLAAVALFALIPETAAGIGWPVALGLAGCGYGLLEIFDRAGLPVCPSCSHSHGFSGPLLAATAIHAFVDGWDTAVQNSSILAALLLHKIPEGLALGAILRMSAGKPARASGLAVLAESPTLAGGLLGLWAAQARWLDYPLALAGGAYLFLGLHAIRAWLRPAHEHEHRARA